MTESAISAVGLEKSFTGKKALESVSFELKPGQIKGLLGPNGAGKTTLLRILTGIFEADTGEIRSNTNRLRIGYLPEERGLYKKMRVEEFLTYMANLHEIPGREAITQIDTWLSKLNLTDWKKSEIGNLSKGMQQKVQFISTVLHEPQLLILDEPFSGFDPVNEQIIIKEILNFKASGGAILLSTHRMDSVEELCDEIIFLNEGKVIYDGDVKQLREKHQTGELELKTKSEIQGLEHIHIQDGVYTYEIGTLDHLPPKDELISLQYKQKSLKEIFIKEVNG